MANCTHCTEPATMRCRKHGQALCFDPYCVELHRWGGGKCEFFDVNRKLYGWKLEVFRWVTALGIGCLIAWFVS